MKRSSSKKSGVSPALTESSLSLSVSSPWNEWMAFVPVLSDYTNMNRKQTVFAQLTTLLGVEEEGRHTTSNLLFCLPGLAHRVYTHTHSYSSPTVCVFSLS